VNFLDTNVVVYAVDRDEPEKGEVARRLMATSSDELVISTQVLVEFFWNVTRRIARPIARDTAASLVRDLSRLRVVGVDAPFVVSAIELAGRRQLALWDALIVRAAQVAGCERLLTEDLHDGARFGDVVVANPFREVVGA
jgi:predicted nucleic acid-binding protein